MQSFCIQPVHISSCSRFFGREVRLAEADKCSALYGGVIIVSLRDSGAGANEVASHPVLRDFLSLLSAAFYAAYAQGRVSMAQFLGFLGLFNFIIFFPVALRSCVVEARAFRHPHWEAIWYHWMDSLIGITPHPLVYIGAAAVMIGFTGLNFPSYALSITRESHLQLQTRYTTNVHNHLSDAAK
ncbi:hypothetical protein SASPL_137824 [Salvia splendens]|uniref:Uncharacterized protein n=1 Tax=Salvia splendens TaxID=180675 RepID=A0A8X8ZEE7_SALSN|nr:hypothetical protein SASPL_137824 [Salvia splendens]